MGKDPWQRMYLDYKYKLFVQCAGRKAFDGEVSYDVERNRLMITPARISHKFLLGYAGAVKGLENKNYPVNTLLSFIERTVGIKNLSVAETELLQQIVE